MVTATELILTRLAVLLLSGLKIKKDNVAIIPIQDLGFLS